MGFDSRSPSCPRGGGGDSSCELPVRSRGEGHGSDPCPLCHLRREGCGQSEQPRERKEAELCHPGLHCLSGVPGCTPRERAGTLRRGSGASGAQGGRRRGWNKRVRSGACSGFAPGSQGRGVFASGSLFTPPKGLRRTLTCCLEGGDRTLPPQSHRV